MKIKFLNGEKIDTDKLPDADADIMEAINNLYNVCARYDKTFIVRVIMNDKGYLGATNFTDNENQKLKDYGFLVDSLAEFVSESSNGALKIVESEA